MAILFLKHPEIKKKLNGVSLDIAVTEFLKSCNKDLFSDILQDDLLKTKLYTSEETKELFILTLFYATEKRKAFLQEFLSYPDLKDKVKHLNFIPEFLKETLLGLIFSWSKKHKLLQTPDHAEKIIAILHKLSSNARDQTLSRTFE